jgi:hypothetical protein
MVSPLRKWFFPLLVLPCLMENVTSARPIPQSKKAPATKQERTKKATAKQKAEFRRWLNDPKIGQIERVARKTLGWGIYGATPCGSMWNEDQVDEAGFGHQKVVRCAVNQYENRKPFIYTIEEMDMDRQQASPGAFYWVEYRAVTGTRSGEVYEFWWKGTSFTGQLLFTHRKWKKPTVKKKGNAILFFDASQKPK